MTAPAPDTPSMLPAALWWARNGHPIFPLWWPVNSTCACPAGDRCHSPAKHPLTPNGLHDATDNEQTIRDWWARWPNANIGLPTGNAFDVIDIDGAAEAWADFTRQHGTPEHMGIVVTGRGTGGFHLYAFPGGQKTIPSGKRGLPKGVEVKGAGGYVVAPPSLHASGNTYRWLANIDDGTIHGDIDWPTWYQTITATADREPFTTPTSPPSPVTDTDRATRYGAAVLTRACDTIRTAGEGGRWNALALEAIPLAARAIAGGCLNRATAEQALEQAARDAGLDQWETRRIPELIDHITRQGITNPIAPPAEDPTPVDTRLDQWLDTLPKADTPADYVAAAGEPTERERTSWWPRNLGPILNGEDPEPHPAHLTRTDGHRLFYPGKVNGLIGESESGKTWVALHACEQALHEGQRVTYLDFEDTAAGIINRFRLLGVNDNALAHLAYIGPDENLHQHATEDLAQALHDHAPDLVIIDGFNAAMTLLGLDLNSNTDATIFAQRLLKPIARTGAAVIYIDHVPKSKEARGKGGIGAQAKRAMTTGCALQVDITDPFGRGMTGRLKLTVDKDRPGHVRSISAGAKHAGDAVIESSTDGAITMHIHAPDLTPPDQRGPWKPTGLMERITDFLASLPDREASTHAIEEATPGKREHIRAAINALVDDGYITRSKGARGAIVHRLERRYDPIDTYLDDYE